VIQDIEAMDPSILKGEEASGEKLKVSARKIIIIYFLIFIIIIYL